MKLAFEKIEIRNINDVPDEEAFAKGHRTCQGCGPALALRLISKAAGLRSIAITATGCMYVANTSYYTTPWVIPWMHTQLGGAGAATTGVAAALKALMRKGKLPKEDINVIAFSGDGGTIDIGLSSLSGALIEQQDFLFVLYDNESYANTGIQASGTTSWGAWTTFTPPGKMLRLGHIRTKKDALRLVAMGHPSVPYAATASISYPYDLMTKVRKGLAVKGTAFLHVQTPCPKGWRFPPDMTIDIGRLNVETGLWILAEIEKGAFRLTYKPKVRKPVAEAIRAQGRFAHLRDADIRVIQESVDAACAPLGF
jgi:pyruvate ferredoxin oxidoreductase beta subunit/oxalate oxidoreductase subunit beta